ncbi:MAG: tRNA (N6-isopentenyl adenosine(37)-C2)-methylthiotransferase MiaB [Peptostreptococcaceae bacterium]|nr:tRNA (N6-isopentenyl adenosine(37)-C2)-methylthiotransferase MiaB [Peptostreptococcaceae bacterium]
MAEIIDIEYPDSKPKVYTETWGCQMNEHDTENLLGMIDHMGYEEADAPEEADLIIFNTCAVRENAELKVYGNLNILRKLKEKKPDLIIAVCGCMMQQKHVVEEIKKRYPFVSIVFGTHNIYKFPEMLYTYLQKQESNYDVWDIDGRIVEGLPVVRRHKIKSFVNIMYGCNNFCTYCIVPFTRGRERSRTPEDIVEEVRQLVASGVKEITLLGQNVNSYGKTLEDPITFHQLLEILNEIQGLERIRFMTSHPKDISEELLEAMARLGKVCESLHLPVQSGSTRVLREMNRHYSKEDYLKTIELARKYMPNLGLTTDIMVGFPGETEEDFLETIEVVEKAQYDLAFTFLYSRRKGTSADRRVDQIPEEVKKERFDRLLDAVNKAAENRSSAYLGKVSEILVEGKSKKNEQVLTGRNRQNKTVNFIGEDHLIGELVKVRIIDAKSFSLTGELIVEGADV